MSAFVRRMDIAHAQIFMTQPLLNALECMSRQMREILPMSTCNMPLAKVHGRESQRVDSQALLAC